MGRNPDHDWFKVYIDVDAELIASGSSEEDAINRVVDYCNANTFLGLDPEMMLPHGVCGKPLSPIEGSYYSTINDQTGTNRTRLIADKRSLPEPVPLNPKIEIIVNEDQFCLFSMTRHTGTEMRYSYYSE